MEVNVDVAAYSAEAGVAAHEHTEPVADRVIKSLSFPSQGRAVEAAVSPPPIAVLMSRADDRSISYSMARVDASGTVPATSALEALSWKPGKRIGYRIESGALVVYPSADGLHVLPKKPSVVIPAPLRHVLGVVASHQLLLGALTSHEALVIYPPSALNRMVGLFHSTADDVDRGATSRIPPTATAQQA
ncbi:hypothetical protein [Amycolatopsis sp. lyj-112]|uniref:hypothetical protein n=1 Tax=Amycolatopsis sp. lyj-112 TaxID=2789288 RepID=UPI003978DE58